MDLDVAKQKCVIGLKYCKKIIVSLKKAQGVYYEICYRVRRWDGR